MCGKEGYLGRNGFESGGIYFTNGQPLIQTPDLTTTAFDWIHHKELKAISDFVFDKNIPETVSLMNQEWNVTDKDEKGELWFQMEDQYNRWTVFKTYKCLLLGKGSVEENAREMRKGIQRVADFYLVNTY